MKVVILLSLFVIASAFDFPEETEWEQWKKAHGKQYSSDSEELHRHIVWQANKKYIDQHNSQSSVFGYTLALNQFGDLESSEFNHLYKGYRQSLDGKRSGKPFVPSTSVKDLPVTVDWRPKGYVTPVKNQGQCGSCWAFSATGSLEGQHFNVTGKLVSLSEQNLVDCSTAEGNMGCNGGLPDQAFQYIIKVGGIDTEASYPYKGENENCKFSKANIGSNCTAYVDVKKDSEIDLQTASATIGPISVGIDASHIGFQFYVGGVYDPIFCSKTDLDHGVLVVGYGVFDGKDYWLVKNSWGVDWGLKGYIMMARNKDNKCGIATEASYPIVTA